MKQIKEEYEAPVVETIQVESMEVLAGSAGEGIPDIGDINPPSNVNRRTDFDMFTNDR